MLTIQEARERLEAYFAQHPPAMSGELYISDDWNEDDSDYLPAWGAREFFVEHRQSFVRMDNLALFIDKKSEEHTSELQSLMRISYAVFCLKKKQEKNQRDALN